MDGGRLLVPETDRCAIGISLGWHPGVPMAPSMTPGLHSRCMLEDDGHQEHTAKGLAQFVYQRWHWFSNDRRAYRTDRSDDAAWEL